jgi:hypothetical protein
MAREPLPAALATVPFTVAQARALRVRPGRLRGRDLSRTTQSVRAPIPLPTLPHRAEAFALALPPDAAFSHVTAAQLWRLPLPPRLEQHTLLDVMRDSDRGRVVRGGCAGHKGLEIRAVEMLGRLRVVGLADVWCDLGTFAGHGLNVDDLVIVGDEVIRRLDRAGAPGLDGTGHENGLGEPFQDLERPRSTGHAALAAALSRRRHHRGKRSLDAAFRLIRSGSRSPGETRARLMFDRAGFPPPLLNHPVRDRAGGWLLEGDLVWEDARVVGEYQGEVHAPITRRSSDAHRRGLAEDEGWRVLEIFAEDVVRPARRVTCLTRFAGALGLDPRRLAIG